MSESPANHIIIGLGGTGGKVLRAFRKTIFQNYRAESPQGVNLGYLYVDSSDSMMALDDPTWKILGTNVQLPQQSQLKIAGLNLSEVLDNVTNFPGIAPWIGNRDSFREIIRGADSANIVGGQKRRLGRFLFACRVGQYRDRISAIVRQLQVGNTTAVTFHFVLGFAGGTGAGTIVDAICQARAMFPTTEYRIIIYGLLPDKNPKPNRAGPNYHANGYAALLELNALDVGSYLPYDISGTQAARLDLHDPFNLCYLFTDENEDGNRVDIDTELPDIIASFLFQKIVDTKDFVWKSADGDAIKRQERFEIGSQADEKEKAPATGRPERTRRFFTFGTKQIAYPEEEIREYLTYTYARQAALQLQFNNFSESFGYVEQAAPQSFNELVRTPELALRWLITDDDLTLSDGILADERANKKWKPITKYWADILPNFKDMVETSDAGDQLRWLSELYKLFDLAFESNYRDLGVRRFYDAKHGEQDEHVREIRRTVEGDLFGDWLNGTKSMTDITRLVQALIAHLGERRALFEEACAKNADLVKQSEARVNANGQEWAHIGVFGEMLGKRKHLFEAHGETLRELYTLRTQTYGLQFARGLLDALVTDLTGLANEAALTASTITSATLAFATAINERLGDAGQSDVQAQIVRFYKPDIVKDFARSLVRNEEQQKLQSAAVRTAITASLGESPTFTLFNRRINEQLFRNLLEQTSALDVEKAHDAITNADVTREHVLRVSVLDRLEKEYGSSREALRAYITQIVSKAKNQIVFNPAEVQRVVPGNESLGPMFHYSTIVIPDAKDKAAFRDAVIEEFNNAFTVPHEVVTNPKRPNVITLISVTSAFPARFVRDVTFLKDRYDARVGATDADQARFELHTEGDGTQWPGLFLRKITRDDALPLLLLGCSLGNVKQLEDPQTGVSAFYLLTRDAAGRDNAPRLLGKEFAEAADSVDAITFDELDNSIDTALTSTYVLRNKREELYVNVHSAVNEITTARPNPLDALRQAYIAADRAIETRLGLSS
jgi:hypothetical protein